MKHESFPVFGLLAAGICLGLGCAQRSEQVFSEEEVGARDSSKDREGIDPMLLEKVRPLYPEIQLQPAETGVYFSLVREVFRVRIDDATERLMVEVRWVIPNRGGVDHGGGVFLLYKDAEDAVPISKVPTFVLGFDTIRLVENRWVGFGDGPLLSLLEDTSLQDFRRTPGRLLDGLARSAATEALKVYLKEGLNAFLELAPIRAGEEHKVRSLPERASRVELYPALVEDVRESGFLYSSPWEETVLVRVTSGDPTQEAVILEIGAKGWAEGIDIADVELVLQETSGEEPTDRPGPVVVH